MATILLIDDDVMLLASVGVQLEDAGYTVFKASEIAHAELLFREECPDLVLLEVRIGRDAGWDLLERFASQATVIVLSASGREEDVIRGLNAGAVDYIAKPYRSGELLTRIQLRLKMASQRAVAVAPAPLPAEHAVSTLPHGTQDAITDGGPVVEDRAELSVAREYEQAQTTGHTEQPGTDPDSVVVPVQVPIQAADSGEQSDLASNDLSSSAPVSSTPTPHHADQVVDYTGQRPSSKRDPVFMPESEELALLRSSEQVTSTVPDMFLPELSLGQRLHNERLRRRITLVQAESELHIRMWYLQAMEEEKFALLPRGPLAAQMLRSYATYLGLDEETTMEEYQRLHYTAPVEPPASLGSLRKMDTRTVRWGVWIAAVALALVVSGAGIFFFDPGGVNALSSSLRGLIVAPTITRVPTATVTTAPTSTPTAMPTETPTPDPPPPPPSLPPEGESPEGEVPPERELLPEGEALPESDLREPAASRRPFGRAVRRVSRRL